LLLAILHGLEASLWAAAYVWLGASPDFTHAVFFSLQMITTLGADVVFIDTRWKLMGPLEAMSGMLLFGLSTAFLLAVLQRAWPFALK
jgi:Ion channel